VFGPVRRIVTGFDAAGRPTIQSDGVPTQVHTLPGNGPTVYEIWNTCRLPAARRNESRMCVLDFLPEGRDRASPDQVSVRTHLSSMALTRETISGGQSGRGLPFVGESIDYCIVLLGEMTLIREETETVVRAGDIVVQRDTQHAWVNRSGRLCRVVFILVDAAVDGELAGQPG